MDETRIRKIVQEELKRTSNTGRFNVRSVPQHVHNGSDSPLLPETSINRNPGVMGNVMFASSGEDYVFEINMPYTPRQVILNGIFVDSPTGSAPIDDRYHIWGTAYLGPAYYLQPIDNRTVGVGGIPYPAPTNLQDGSKATIPAQSSTFFGFIQGSSEATAGTSQFHIADVFGSATLRVTVVDFSKDKIVFRVTSMTSGWSLIGNYLII